MADIRIVEEVQALLGKRARVTDLLKDGVVVQTPSGAIYYIERM